MVELVQRVRVVQSVWRWDTGWTAAVRISVEARFLFSPQRPGRLWVPPSLLYNEYRGQFPRAKETGA
jgi:hypothetical protein